MVPIRGELLRRSIITHTKDAPGPHVMSSLSATRSIFLSAVVAIGLRNYRTLLRRLTSIRIFRQTRTEGRVPFVHGSLGKARQGEWRLKPLPPTPLPLLG